MKALRDISFGHRRYEVIMLLFCIYKDNFI